MGGFGSVTPRPYQLEAHRACRDSWGEDPELGALLVMATGTGKTLTALSLAVSDFLALGLRVVWLAHRQELLDQPAREMAKHWPQYTAGIVQASRHAPDAAIVFASVATLARSPDRTKQILTHGAPALVVVDEAHHAAASSHLSVLDSLTVGPVRPLTLGLTATPHRADGEDLSKDWRIVYSYGTAEAIRDGFLLQPYAVVDRLPDLNLEELSGRWDYDDGELGAELLRAGIVDHTVTMITKPHTLQPIPAEISEGIAPIEETPAERSGLVFTATVEQARLTAEALTAAGIESRHISGETPNADRRRLLRAFSNGTIRYLCNAAVLTEGTDLPVASVVVLARPTRSWSLYVQMVGRGLRLHGDQSRALVLDAAGATEDHSLISAPVLIGGSACPKSPNGAHVFGQIDNGRGKCEHCGATVACFPLLGGHEWGKDLRCTGCNRPKCEESPTLDHAWLRKADFKKQCLYCGCEIVDPMASMVGERRKRSDDAVEGDWVRIRKVRPNLAAVDVGEFGILFVRWAAPEAFEPLWLPKRARKVRPLSDRPVSSRHVRAYGDDLVTRAAKVADVAARWKMARPTANMAAYGERWGVFWRGESAGEYARKVFGVRARSRAIAVGIVEEV